MRPDGVDVHDRRRASRSSARSPRSTGTRRRPRRPATRPSCSRRSTSRPTRSPRRSPTARSARTGSTSTTTGIDEAMLRDAQADRRSSPAAPRYHAGLVGRYAIEEWARLPGRDGHRLRVPLPQPGGRPGRPRHRHHAVGRDGRHAGGDAPGARARRDGARGDQRDGLAGHARRRRRPLHARRPRDRRRGDEDLRLPGRGRCTCWRCGWPSCAARCDRERRTRAGRRAQALPHAHRPSCSSRSTSASSAIADGHQHGASFFLYLGRHVGLPVALEGALKLKEISYIPTDAYAAGEMKHGPIALLDERTPVVVRRDRLAGARQGRLQHAGGPRPRRPRDRRRDRGQRATSREHAEEVLHVPRTDWMLQPLLAVIPLQLLAYRDRAPARAQRRPAAQPRQDRHRRVGRLRGGGGVGLDLLEIERLERALERRPAWRAAVHRRRARLRGGQGAARPAPRRALLREGGGGQGAARSRRGAGSDIEVVGERRRRRAIVAARRAGRALGVDVGSCRSTHSRATGGRRGARARMTALPDWLEPLPDAERDARDRPLGDRGARASRRWS